MSGTNYTIARLYPANTAQELPELPPDVKILNINNKEIRFFRDVLQQQMQFFCNKSGWWLYFFRGEAYEQVFYVGFQKLEEMISDIKANKPPAGYSWPVATLVFSKVNDNLPQVCEHTSKLLYGSCTIQHQDLYETRTHYGHVSGRGMQYLAKWSDDQQFLRHVLLHALAHAYLLSMEQLSNQLANMLVAQKSDDDLRALYKTMAEFNAKSFFHQPVKLGNSATCEAWVRINQVLGITESNRELSAQVSQAHDIFAFDAAKQAQINREKRQEQTKMAAEQQAAKDRRLERFLMMISILIALVSVPNLIDFIYRLVN
ncbi:hypothetical protein PT286_00535 [Neisseriaceae bacterium ESL0693]|nr:hypothetical protein [Neisseriaceae bacterium ESL0693]